MRPSNLGALRSPRSVGLALVLALLGAAPAAAQRRPFAARPEPQKISSAEAAKLVGKKIYFATGSATPISLVKPIREQAIARHDAGEGRTDGYFMSTFASGPNFKQDIAHKFHSNLFFVSMANRDAATGKWATLNRDSLFGLAKRLRAGEFGIDTVVVRVSPPDKDGFVSLGTTGDLTLPAIHQVLRAGGKIIAEVNPNVPNVRGNRIPYRALTAVFDSQEPLSELQQLPPNPVEARMAHHVASLIPDGSTLQVGIGGSLSGLGDALKARKELHIFSEMGTDSWVLPLMQGEHPIVKEATFSFLHGTSALYKFADGNDRVRIGSSLSVNNPSVIARQPNMVAVNTALEVDLSGNTNAEKIGDRVISAPGGQPNFMEGASRSPTGKAVLALRSTNKNGDTTIVLGLHGPVTTPKEHVDYVVTEWGTTQRMRGLDEKARAFEMVSVAHPLHRMPLAEAAKKQGLFGDAEMAKLRASILPALKSAPDEIRRDAADRALAQNLIGAVAHAELVAGLPAIQAVMP